MSVNIAAGLIAGAIIFDLLIRRIPNCYVIGVYVAGIIFNIYMYGISSIYQIIISALWPIPVLYIFYYLGAVGAGDVKLFSCISLFLPTNFTIRLIIISFVTAAVYGCLQMLFCRTFISKILSVKNYVQEALATGCWGVYQTNEEDSFICFSVFIGVGFIITKVLEAMV